MRMIVCIPAYNEAGIIVESVRRIRHVLDRIPGIEGTVLVVDNGSMDGTAEIVAALTIPGVSVQTIAQKGKGAAILSAVKGIDTDLFGFIDADLSADPECFVELIAAIEGGADIAVGSRLMKDAHVERGFLRTLSSRIFNELRQLLLGVHVEDTQCGIKLADPKGYAQLAACQETGWFLDVEWLARAERAGCVVREIPITWTESYFPDRVSRLNVLSDGIGALRAFFRIRNRLNRPVV